jgi:hydroxylamine reductase
MIMNTGEIIIAIPIVDYFNRHDGKVTLEELEQRAKKYGVLERKLRLGDDIAGLQELITYGIKGMAAYADHAAVLGKTDPEIANFIHETFDQLENGNLTAEELLNTALNVTITN